MNRRFQRDEGPDPADAKDQLLCQLEMQRTEAERELAALRESHQHLRLSSDYYTQLYRQSPIARVMLDTKSKIKELNIAAEKLIGMRREDLLGLPFTLFLRKKSFLKFVDHLHRCRLFPGDRIESELIFDGRKQKEMSLQILSVGTRVNGKMYYQTALIDVQTKKDAEALFERAKKCAADLVQMVDQPLLMLDAELFVVSANPAFYRRFKTEAKNIIGRPLPQLAGSIDARERLLEVIERKKTFRKLRVETGNGNGAKRILLLSAQPYFGGPRGEELVLLSIDDDTESATANQEREQLLQKLSQMGRELEWRVEERTSELQLANWKLQTLSARMLEAQEVERRHLARELHDEIGQQITCLQILIEKQFALAPLPLRRALRETRRASAELLETVRELSSELRPQLLDDFGLHAALIWHFKKFHKRTGIKVHLDEKDFHDDLLNSFLRNILFRTTQEALTNVARHADTKSVAVSLSTKEGLCRLQVSDKGKGFDVDAALEKGSFGLAGIQERTFLGSGNLKIDSAPGKGTILTIELPLISRQTDAVEQSPS